MHKSQKIVLSFLMAASLASATVITQGETKPAAQGFASVPGTKIKSGVSNLGAGVSVVYKVYSTTAFSGSVYYDIYSQVRVTVGQVASQTIDTNGATVDVTRLTEAFDDFAQPTTNQLVTATNTATQLSFAFSSGVSDAGPIMWVRVAAGQNLFDQSGKMTVSVAPFGTTDYANVTANSSIRIRTASLADGGSVSAGTLISVGQGVISSGTTLDSAVYLVGVAPDGSPLRDFYFQAHGNGVHGLEHIQTLALSVPGIHMGLFRYATGFGRFVNTSGGFIDVSAVLQSGVTTLNYTAPALAILGGGNPGLYNSPIVRVRVSGAYTDGAYTVSTTEAGAVSWSKTFVNNQ